MKIYYKKLIKDILKDKDSEKFSTTKTIALSTFILFGIIIMFSIYIMLDNKSIDYFLIGELIIFILTMLGFKNIKINPNK